MPRAKRTPQIIGYTRVSTAEQGDSRLGLEAQEAAIRAECDRKGWTLTRIATDTASGASAVGRPGFTEALDDLDAARGGVLIATKLDRLSRSVIDFGTTLERAKAHGWSVVVLDLGVDTSTSTGKLVAGIMVQVAEWEREQIGERTAAALQAKKARGARLGRPVGLPQDVRNLIGDLRAEGFTMQAIADRLNAQGVPTARGGTTWRPSSVHAVLESLARDAEAAAASLAAA